MAYKAECIRQVTDALAKSRQTALAQAEQRRREIEAKIPDVARFDLKMEQTGLSLFRLALGGREGLDEKIEALKQENLLLQKMREDALAEKGYPRDYLKPRFGCSLCEDTGYVKGKMCICMKKALSEAEIALSGMGTLLHSMTFDNFDLGYYTEEHRKNMERNLALCRRFADTFTPKGQEGGNLLLCGGTGLGKTHLSGAIAGRVMSRGYEVKYVSAPELFRTFEEYRFFRAQSGDKNPIYDYYNAELLIVDDLGAETKMDYTVSCLYELLNVRFNNGRPIVFSTNLTVDALREYYGDRIFSRILGNSKVLLFFGDDIRKLKVIRNSKKEQ